MVSKNPIVIKKFRFRNPFAGSDSFELVKRAGHLAKGNPYKIQRVIDGSAITVETFSNLRKADRAFKKYREKFSAAIISMLMIFVPAAAADPVITGKATYYTVASAQAEGTSGILTASGERYDEAALTCAVRSRDFGTVYRVTNPETGLTIHCRQNDYGPGRGPTARGVIVDLTPAAYDALGCRRGVNKRGVAWGECKIEMERV